jgi:cytoskeletal protein CcmA (bactofilin family)
MAIWKDIVTKDAEPNAVPAVAAPINRPRPEAVPMAAPQSAAAAAAARKELKESVIATGLTFEGKIEGSGHVRISGRFKGDVHIDGMLTVETGAHLAGSVRAGSVIVAGEIEGNIESAHKVELHQTGVVNGDVNAGSLSVAGGARMRGRAEFGWNETGSPKGGGRV